MPVATFWAMGGNPGAPDFYKDFPEWFSTIFQSGISSAAVVAIILNMVFNHAAASKSLAQPSSQAESEGLDASATSQSASSA
ncbi:hypothetical protein [Pararhodobacter sp.]|nr:hypothetical protein [Pararhodobacter sp.]